MRRAIAMVAALLVASLGVSAAGEIVQVSYETVMAMSPTERQAVLRGLEQTELMDLNRINLDRWLEQNRPRLSASQIALVRDVRRSFDAVPRDLSLELALQNRMRCELWRSDVRALSMTHRDEPASRLGDWGFWLGECVVKKTVNAVF